MSLTILWNFIYKLKYKSENFAKIKFSRYLKNILYQFALFSPPLPLELRTVSNVLDIKHGAKLDNSTNTNINNDWFQVSGDLESLSEDNWAQAAGLPAWRSAGLRSRKKDRDRDKEKGRKREKEREKTLVATSSNFLECFGIFSLGISS